MSKKNLNWKAYWRIMSVNRMSPLATELPSMKTEDMLNWFNCNEEMRWKFTNIKEGTY